MTATMTKPFHVQFPPRTLFIDCNDYYKFGDNITFKARLKSGTNVSFNWNFGDQNQLVDAGELLCFLLLHLSFVLDGLLRNNLDFGE